MRIAFHVLVLGALLSACGTDPDPPVDNAPFPLSYRDSYMEVRNCRKSGDHELNYIRILADAAALEPYRMRMSSFPTGSIVLKEEFDFADDTCSGPIKQWTVMTKLAAGSSPSTLDWKWHRVNTARTIVETDPPRCIGCHTLCGVPPDGYEATCAVP
jgi:hypothetical protein